MPKKYPLASNSKYNIERPLTLQPYRIAGDHLMLFAIRPEHLIVLHAEIFSQPNVMKYFGEGRTYELDEFVRIQHKRIKQNSIFMQNENTKYINKFTWTIVTHDGIGGRINIFPYKNDKNFTELAVTVSPYQQGRGIGSRASELIVKYLWEETQFMATAHPLNIKSVKMLGRIRFPDGNHVFYRDSEKQNVKNVYGKNQPRDYYKSQRENKFSFFSFNKNKTIEIEESLELAQQSPSQNTVRN